MLLKVIIVLLFIAVLISLSSGLVFLMKDVGNTKKRLLYSLGIRAGLAAMLVAVLTYGVVTGQLGSTAPWDKQLHPERIKPASQQ